MKPLFIAEVKTRSPFGFRSEHSWEDLFEIAAEHGDAVAVHTENRWGGDFDRVREAREKLPRRRLVIAKGIHASDEAIRIALFHGADLVTVVGRLPPRELAPVCIWEPSSFSEMLNVLEENPGLKTMWNERDLATGLRRTGFPEDNIVEARNWTDAWLCQASFIETPEDVHPGVDAFIVGEHLPTFAKKWA